MEGSYLLGVEVGTMRRGMFNSYFMFLSPALPRSCNPKQAWRSGYFVDYLGSDVNGDTKASQLQVTYLGWRLSFFSCIVS